MGCQSLLQDLGVKVDIEMMTDSTAGKSIIGRTGVGKLRHLETKYLWVQQATRQGRLKTRKVKGTENPADVGTKYLSRVEMQKVLKQIGIHIGSSRS